MANELDTQTAWLDQPLFNRIKFDWVNILFLILIVIAVISRFYDLESRVMSHDENTHVYYSWRFAKGEGLAHDPLMHGPFQFHLVALSYFIFGDNDFTARIPGALFSIATVGFMWFYRRYLGNAGALAAALMFVISPYLLYYGRYVRNEVYVAFFGVVTIWSILRYLETGKERYTFYLIAVTALHFTAKETSFIYTAQAMLFLALYFIARVSKLRWQNEDSRKRFILVLIIGLLLVAALGGVFLVERTPEALSATETAQPAVPGEEIGELAPSGPSTLLLILLILSILAFFAAAFFLIQGYTWKRLREERSFGILILLGTMVLPQLAAFPMRLANVTIPTNAASVMALTTQDIWIFAAFVIPLALIAVIVGLLWNPRLWLINAAIFFGIFVVFYTSVFTNGAGFFSGLVGSLGYWLEQQGVERGSQPWYYYWAVQIPVYEYLPALGTLLAAGILLVRKISELIKPKQTNVAEEHILDETHEDRSIATEDRQDVPIAVPEYADEHPSAIDLFLFWSFTSLIAYSVAGEKMPWLTVHIAMPLILSAAWAINQLIVGVDWSLFRHKRGLLVLVLLPVFVLSSLAVLGSLLGPNRPFMGQDLNALQATSTFITGLITAIASGVGLYVLVKPWPGEQFNRVLALFVFAFLGFLTARVAITAAYINYDYANELLVYAHSAPGVKTAMAQIEEISRRTTDGTALEVAYDNETSYPYWWYLRNYSNQRYFGDTPTRSLRDAPVILVGDANFGKIEQIVGSSFNQFDYIRLWWPNQDYFGLTWERIWNALRDPQMRSALFEIWLNRDYTSYAELLGRDMSAPNWSPAARMRLYIRKDIVAKLWNYGVAPTAMEVELDPWDGKQIQLMADKSISGPGSEPGLFQNPRDLEVAQDGSLYVVDTDNNRIQHLSPDGDVLQVWGSYADATAGGEAPGGTFSQPWGIGLAPDGSVYVADTWNHRVQKFTATGEFVTMWGYFGQGESPQAFWGPRDVAIDNQGRVYITDTGNKRVVIFDEEGNYIDQFGGAGFSPGLFDEPVGIAIDSEGRIYVADTWNQRIQTFVEDVDGFRPDSEWDVAAWYGQSLDNKPYLSVDDFGRVFASDPDGFRVLEFNTNGEPIQFWGDFGSGLDTFGLPASVAVDQEGGVWVTDARNGRLMHFVPPIPTSP